MISRALYWHHSQNGLTLVELVVALLLASVVSVVGIGLTRQTLAATATAQSVISDMEDLAVARRLIEADLVALAGVDMVLADDSIGFRRIADSVRRNHQPSPPVMISYAVADGVLVRQTSDGSSRSLLDVSGFRVRFLGSTGWTRRWPQRDSAHQPPRAVELVMTSARWGDMTLVFPVGLAVGPR